MKLVFASIVGLLATQLSALAVPSNTFGRYKITDHPDPEKRALLQNLVRRDCPSRLIPSLLRQGIGDMGRDIIVCAWRADDDLEW